MGASIILGDCLESLRKMPAESVQCCVTSPPYYGLRDYGEAGQIGLEDTPDTYVEKLVQVFTEVNRVLKNDGTLWLNLGDSYASKFSCTRRNLIGNGPVLDKRQRRDKLTGTDLKEKDLIGIPWLVAFALRRAGWYLRQDIIWSKPNAMPESVKDRCTKSHEYIFLFSKSAKYYYDYEAIKEPAAAASIARMSQDIENQKGSDRVPGKTNGNMKAVMGRNKSQSFKRDSRVDKIIPGQAKTPHREDRKENDYDLLSRNKRSVWEVTTKPYKGAHFATFPADLILPCILAGSRPGDIVLDPFNGSGTTGQVALENKRDYIGLELNPEYVELTHKRLERVQIGL